MTHKELVDVGWERKYVGAEPRISEFVELYESLGFEVRVENLNPEELDQECTECYEAPGADFKIIYTRESVE